ncbi:MAG: lantibiotic modifying enzyme [Crocinitomix sp.]|jgi:lantibiotic modifying enzyme
MKEKINSKLKEFYELYNQSFDPNGHHSLYSGQSGVLLFRLYYQVYLNTPNPKLENDLVAFISNQLETTAYRPAFANGIAGFAWFLQHLNVCGFIELDEEILGHFDEDIIASAKQELKGNNHDFMHGGLGAIVHLLQRYPHKLVLKETLIELAQLLEKTGVKSDKGITWHEDSDYLEGEENSTVINFHISHGQASKILILTKMVEKGIGEVKPLLTDAIRFLLSYQDIETGLIPSRLVDNKKELKTHSGWCRSNIAIGLSLYQAALVLEDDLLAKKAIEIGLNTIDRSLEPGQMPSDATFCHGKIGISQMYNRYYQYTGVDAFKKAADQWMHFTLDSAVFEDGIAGFKSWNSVEGKWENKHGLLSGVAGIGLGLLTYISEDANASAWDAALLLS